VCLRCQPLQWIVTGPFCIRSEQSESPNGKVFMPSWLFGLQASSLLCPKSSITSKWKKLVWKKIQFKDMQTLSWFQFGKVFTLKVFLDSLKLGKRQRHCQCKLEHVLGHLITQFRPKWCERTIPRQKWFAARLYVNSKRQKKLKFSLWSHSSERTR